MENTPLKTNRMPYFNRYQAMGRQVSNVTQTLSSTHFGLCVSTFLYSICLQDLEESQRLRRDSDSSDNPEHDCISLDIQRHPEENNMPSPGKYDICDSILI